MTTGTGATVVGVVGGTVVGGVGTVVGGVGGVVVQLVCRATFPEADATKLSDQVDVTSMVALPVDPDGTVCANVASKVPSDFTVPVVGKPLNVDPPGMTDVDNTLLIVPAGPFTVSSVQVTVCAPLVVHADVPDNVGT